MGPTHAHAAWCCTRGACAAIACKSAADRASCARQPLSCAFADLHAARLPAAGPHHSQARARLGQRAAPPGAMLQRRAHTSAASHMNDPTTASCTRRSTPLEPDSSAPTSAARMTLQAPPSARRHLAQAACMPGLDFLQPQPPPSATLAALTGAFEAPPPSVDRSATHLSPTHKPPTRRGSAQTCGRRRAPGRGGCPPRTQEPAPATLPGAPRQLPVAHTLTQHSSSAARQPRLTTALIAGLPSPACAPPDCRAPLPHAWVPRPQHARRGARVLCPKPSHNAASAHTGLTAGRAVDALCFCTGAPAVQLLPIHM
jgi:hypothetical protein